ncbi:hypothetical protein CNMCM6069_004792 [Aspergillus lentulus]|nr:hypothetical protein CNMCM6069_004792 [Aspergillus lentulus]
MVAVRQYDAPLEGEWIKWPQQDTDNTYIATSSEVGLYKFPQMPAEVFLFLSHQPPSPPRNYPVSSRIFVRDGKVVRLSSKTNELLEIDSKHSAGGIFPIPVFIKSGKGSILKDVDGNEIIDFICMLSATNLGQCHPKLLEAMITSMQTITLTNIATKVGDWAEFARDMCTRFGYDKMAGMVSGTEGADAAVKFARKWGIKVKGIPPRDVLVLGVSDNYHGVGSGIWPIMNDMGQSSDYGIVNENLRNTNPKTGELLKYGCLKDFEQVLADVHGRVAAIIMECIHGKKPSFEEELNFAIGVRQLCKKYNILFIADEVRMGSGKTGKFLCSDWMGPENKPDMVVMGKSITGGAYPASYIFGHNEVMNLVGGYESVATFGMAPAAIAATRATLQIMDEERLVERATWIGQIWKKETADWNMPWLDYTTNRGADLGLYLKRTGSPRHTTRRLSMLCLHKGVLTYPDGDRVRMGVALNIPEADLLRGITSVREALLELEDYDEIETGPPMKGVVPDMHERKASEAGTTRGPFPMALDDHMSMASMHRHSGERPAKRRSRDIENLTAESPSPKNLDPPLFSTTKNPKPIHHSSFTANHHLDFGMQIHWGNAAIPVSYRLAAEDTQAFFANMESQPVDPTRECLQRFSELSSRLSRFRQDHFVMLSELLSFSSCRNTNNINQGARIPQNTNGRALESFQTFLDILQGMKPRLSPTSSADSENPCNPTPTILNPEKLTEVEKATCSRPPANPSAPLSTPIDMPTTLTILTCYTWLLQAYDTIFSQIYCALAIRTDITSPSSIPSVLPGLQFGGFDLDEHRDMQIEMPI